MLKEAFGGGIHSNKHGILLSNTTTCIYMYIGSSEIDLPGYQPGTVNVHGKCSHCIEMSLDIITRYRMNWWVDGWMDGWMDGCMDGWMDG